MTRPPLLWLLAYRVLGLRLPVEHRPWVAQDVTSRFFLVWRIGRTTLWLWLLCGLYYVALTRVYESPDRRTMMRLILVTLAVALLSSGKTLVRRTLRWQRIDKHGRATASRGLALLENREAVVFGGAVLVAAVSAMALVGYAMRPTGPAGAPCRTPDAETISLIRAGLKDQRTELISPNAVRYGNGAIVAAVVKIPETSPDRAGVWVVEDGQVYELRTPEQAEESATTFAPPPSVDRVAVEALRRAVTCLQKDRNR